MWAARKEGAADIRAGDHEQRQLLPLPAVDECDGGSGQRQRKRYKGSHLRVRFIKLDFLAAQMASSWRGLVLRLCLVGFFINCQPSEPFLTKYLKREKNITEVRVLHSAAEATTAQSGVQIKACVTDR